MFLSVILIVLTLLLIFSNYRLLVSIPFASWGILQYGTALLSVALAAVCVWSFFRAKKQWKVQKQKITDAYAAENAKLHEKRRALYLDEDIDIEAETDTENEEAAAPETVENTETAETPE
ncbi:MAG: hypothetical protein RRY96_02265 [Ruthenibacterium sp.]